MLEKKKGSGAKKRASRASVITLLGEENDTHRTGPSRSAEPTELAVSDKISSGLLCGNDDNPGRLVEDAVSLWQLLLTQHSVDAKVKEYDAVRLDPVKIVKKVSPETAKVLESGSATGLPSKIFDIRALVSLLDIKRTATDDASITPCNVFRDRLEFFRRFATGFREKFIRWEILRISMLSGFHTDAVLKDKRAGRELTVPLKLSRVPVVIPDSYHIRMSMLNDPLLVRRISDLYQSLTLTRGPISRSVYYALYHCFIKAMLLHLTEQDIHRLITLDMDIDCAEYFNMKKLQALAESASFVQQQQGGLAPRNSLPKMSKSINSSSTNHQGRSIFVQSARGVDDSAPPSAERAGSNSGDSGGGSSSRRRTQAQQSPHRSPRGTPLVDPTTTAGQPPGSFFSRKHSIRSVATIRTWLREQGKSDPEDHELDPVVMTGVDFVRWVCSLVMIWLETHAISDVGGFVDALAELWTSAADTVDVEFADRYVSKVKSEVPSTVPLVPPSACVSEHSLLGYVKRHMVVTIHARFPKFMALEGAPKFTKTGASGNHVPAGHISHELRGGEGEGVAAGGGGSRGGLRRRRASMRLAIDGWPFVINASRLHEDHRVSQLDDLDAMNRQSSPHPRQGAYRRTVVMLPHEEDKERSTGTTLPPGDSSTSASDHALQSILGRSTWMHQPEHHHLLDVSGIGDGGGCGGSAAPSRSSSCSGFFFSATLPQSDGSVSLLAAGNNEGASQQRRAPINDKTKKVAANSKLGAAVHEDHNHKYPLLFHSTTYLSVVRRAEAERLAGAVGLEQSVSVPVWAQSSVSLKRPSASGSSTSTFFGPDQSREPLGLPQIQCNAATTASRIASTSAQTPPLPLGQAHYLLSPAEARSLSAAEVRGAVGKRDFVPIARRLQFTGPVVARRAPEYRLR